MSSLSKKHHQSICPQLQIYPSQELHAPPHAPLPPPPNAPPHPPPNAPPYPPPLAPQSSNNSTQAVNPTITATRLSKGTVLTARAIATSNGKSTPVCVLFDAGSQRSYVSSVVLQRLDMKPVKKKVLHLNTFEENRFKRQNCGVYKLNLENSRTGDGAEIQAVNFPVICSPLRLEVTTNYAHLDSLNPADSDQEESE